MFNGYGVLMMPILVIIKQKNIGLEIIILIGLVLMDIIGVEVKVGVHGHGRIKFLIICLDVFDNYHQRNH